MGHLECLGQIRVAGAGYNSPTFVESLDLLWGVGKLGVWQCPGQSSGLPAWRLNISKHDRICLFDSCMLLLCIPRAVRTLTRLSSMLCVTKKTHQRDVTIGELKGRLQFQCTSYIFQRRVTIKEKLTYMLVNVHTTVHWVYHISQSKFLVRNPVQAALQSYSTQKTIQTLWISLAWQDPETQGV